MNLVDKLIEQAKNPNGFVGSLMLKIMNTAHSEMNKWAFEKINITKSSAILDVGCGGGKTLKLLSKINTDGEIYGIDYSEQAVKNSINKNKVNIAMGKVHIQQASVTNIPFPEDFFDTITTFQTHYFWPNLENSLEEVFRTLKLGGCFFIIAEVYKINYHMNNYNTKVEIENLLKKVGFSTVEYCENPNKKWVFIKGMK